MSLSLYCSLTSCIELWPHVLVSCYKILQDEHQRYQLHTVFYSSSCNFQFFPPNVLNYKSFTNRITIQFQILSTYIISKPQSFSFPHDATLTDSLYSQLPTIPCTPLNAHIHYLSILHNLAHFQNAGQPPLCNTGCCFT